MRGLNSSPEVRHNRGYYDGDLLAEKREEKMEKGIVVATPFEIMDRLDDGQIVEAMKGRIVDTFVYSYTSNDGKKVEGLSKAGVDESCKQLANKGEVIRELECTLEKEDDTYGYFKAKAGRFAISPEKEVLLETKIGHKRQCKFVLEKGNKPNRERPNPFWYEQGGQKSLRNCRRDLLSETFIIELIKQWKGQGKVREIKEENNVAQKPQEKPQGDLSPILHIGKYKGQSYAQIWEKDRQYLEWLYQNTKIAGIREQLARFLDDKRMEEME